MNVSVVIIAHNRQKELEKAIRSLESQTVKPFEIIIIDVASSPCLSMEIRDLNARLIRIDKDIGLSESRNVGINLARGDYIAFIDDDCEASKTWLEEIQKGIKVGGDILGGPLKPIFLSNPPEWWNENDLGYFLGVGNSETEAIWGANMVFNKQVFQDIGFFNTRIGRQNGRLLSGEDSDLVSRGKLFFKVLFVKEAVVYHLVQTERLSLSYIIRWSYYSGKSQKIVGGPGKLAGFLFLKALVSLLNPFKRCRKSERIRRIATMAEQVGIVA